MVSDTVYIYLSYRTLRDQHIIQDQTSLMKCSNVERKTGNNQTDFLELIIKMCVTKYTFI